MRKIYQTRDNLLRAVFVGWIVLFETACSQLMSPQTPVETASVTETQAMPVSPTEGDATQVSQSLPTPADPGLQNLIEIIKTDLANRLAIPIEQIALAEATEVEWSDSSLDCPQPGMEYLQVITPGYRILLQADDQIYEYHSNRDTYFIYCENHFPPIVPKP